MLAIYKSQWYDLITISKINLYKTTPNIARVKIYLLFVYLQLWEIGPFRLVPISTKDRNFLNATYIHSRHTILEQITKFKKNNNNK